ncbi:MAG: tRNA (adenosine(37)-N6)-threonylcarbamoyltransferase complex dimerization subunit type 1 TsaB [candidate division Zixibacteria bacterium]|nr:tRNA (adenosine(37)-N6)-threonylcarbamoyltransferase complex dimerization subunit type 1 TsaB [candidate division Zixibacteria bacterium]
MMDYSGKSILAIDTSSRVLRLGLSFGGDRLVKSSEEVEKSHGQFIIKKIGELVQSAGLQKNDLDGIVAVTGPGSFTGLRIGLAAAKGIAVALNIPVVGVDLFEVAAYVLGEASGEVAVIVPQTRDQYFVAKVIGGAGGALSISTAAAGELVAGLTDCPAAGMGVNIADLFPDLPRFGGGEIIYDVSDVLYLGTAKLTSGHQDDLVTLEPLYLQRSQAEIRFEQRRQKK